jgi:hypothetical protein
MYSGAAVAPEALDCPTTAFFSIRPSMASFVFANAVCVSTSDGRSKTCVGSSHQQVECGEWGEEKKSVLLTLCGFGTTSACFVCTILS